jgi:DNA-binding transcriptional ArsR family regulator
MSSPPSTLGLLEALAEPTRLRLVNCLAAAPLFVTDLQVLLEIPQPTVSRHLKVLREAGLVRDTPIAQYVLYRLAGRVTGGLCSAISMQPSSMPVSGRSAPQRSTEAAVTPQHARTVTEGPAFDPSHLSGRRARYTALVAYHPRGRLPSSTAAAVLRRSAACEEHLTDLDRYWGRLA